MGQYTEILEIFNAMRPDEKALVEACRKEINAILAKHGDAAFIALALIGAKLAEDDE